MTGIDRRRYTKLQLHEWAGMGKLPGFLSETGFGLHMFVDTVWQPVHNVAILRQDGDGLCIATAIRRRETNPTHPDVVSTPTKRLTIGEAHELIRQKSPYLTEYNPRHGRLDPFLLEEVNPARPKVIAEFTPNLEMLDHTGFLAGIALQLLKGKLGMDMLTARQQSLWRVCARISLSKIIAGFSYVSDHPESGEPQYEPIVMFGSVMSARSEQMPLPATSDDYREITWAPLETFAQNVQNRNVAGLVTASEEDVVGACVRGLCLATSERATRFAIDVQEHMGYLGSNHLSRHWAEAP